MELYPKGIAPVQISKHNEGMETWDKGIGDDTPVQFGADRRTPTTGEEELLASKIEAKRLLEKLNGALHELRSTVLPESVEKGEKKRTEKKGRAAPMKRYQPKQKAEKPTAKKECNPQVNPERGGRPEWDSRTIVENKFFKMPKKKTPKLLKKKVIALSDLEKLANMAPSASLRELLDIGLGKAGGPRGKGLPPRKEPSRELQQRVGGSGSEGRGQMRTLASSNRGDAYDFEDTNDSYSEEEEEAYNDDFDGDWGTLASSDSSRLSPRTVGDTPSTIYSTHSPARVDRQIRFLSKIKNKKSGKSGKKKKSSRRKKMKRKNLRRKLLRKTTPNANRSLVASSQANRVKWKDGDISGRSETGQLELPITPVRGILKRSVSNPGNSAPPSRPQSAGFVRLKVSASMNEFGSPKWNWNGPRPWEDNRANLRPRSAIVRQTELEFRSPERALHLPKKHVIKEYVPEYSRLLPMPVTKGGGNREEKIKNYRLEHFPEYNRIGEGEILVTIAHCSNCKHHQLSTRHDEKKYKLYATQLASKIEMNVPGAKVIVRAVGGRMIGAFEVQVCRQQAQKLSKVLMHSKLVTNLWPNMDDIVRRIINLKPKHELVVNVSGKIDKSNKGTAATSSQGLQCTVLDGNGANVAQSPMAEMAEDASSSSSRMISATATLLIPSGAYTLIVDGSNMFLPVKEHVDTTEEVRTVINRVLCERSWAQNVPSMVKHHGYSEDFA